ncbi:Dock9 protein, partial [Thecamonas trahens ATCC 50062]
MDAVPLVTPDAPTPLPLAAPAPTPPPHVADTLALFDASWTVVEREYAEYGRGRPPIPLRATKLFFPDLEMYEVDMMVPQSDEGGSGDGDDHAHAAPSGAKKSKLEQMFEDAAADEQGSEKRKRKRRRRRHHGHRRKGDKGGDAGKVKGKGKTGDVSADADNMPEEDDIELELLAERDHKTDKRNAKIRSQDRAPLLRVFKDRTAIADIPMSDPRRTGPGYLDSAASIVEISFEGLEFELGDIEPFFVSAAVFDLKHNSRLTDYFSTSLNPPHLCTMIYGADIPEFPVTSARRVAFPIMYPHADMWLVVRISKVLQGDYEDAADAYIKHAKKDPGKYHMAAQEFCRRLGAYRQDFAFAAIPLFDKSGKVTVSKRGVPTCQQTCSRLFRLSKLVSETKLLATIHETIKAGNVKKLKAIPGKLKYSVRAAPASGYAPPGRYSPALAPLAPAAIPPDSDTAAAIADAWAAVAEKMPAAMPPPPGVDLDPRPGLPDLWVEGYDYEDDTVYFFNLSTGHIIYGECPPQGALVKYAQPLLPSDDLPSAVADVIRVQQSFVSEAVLPGRAFVNNLHLSLDTLDASKVKVSIKAKLNLGVRVQLKSSDASIGPDDNVLATFYGGALDEPRTAYAQSSVAFQVKNPSFMDEFKLELPLALEPGTHLLFTVFHVNVKLPKKKKNAPPVEEIVGYAVLPLTTAAIYDCPLNIVLAPKASSASDVLGTDLSAPGVACARDAVYHKAGSSALVIGDGLYGLPLVYDLAPGYLTADLSDAAADKGQPMLALRTTLASTVLVQDPALHEFTHVYHTSFDSEPVMKAAVIGLERVACSQTVAHGHLLLHYLLNVALYGRQTSIENGVRKQGVAELAFRALLRTMDILVEASLHTAQGPHSILTNWVNYIFDEDTFLLPPKCSDQADADASVPSRAGRLFSGILDVWLPLLANAKTPASESGAAHAAVLFELVVKSMTLWLDAQTRAAGGTSLGDGPPAPARPARFPHPFRHSVAQVFELLRKHVFVLSSTGLVVAQQLNAALALFARDLFALMNRGFVYVVVQRYVRQFTPATPGFTDSLYRIKLNFLKIVCDYEHAISLSLPGLDTVDYLLSVPTQGPLRMAAPDTLPDEDESGSASASSPLKTSPSDVDLLVPPPPNSEVIADPNALLAAAESSTNDALLARFWTAHPLSSLLLFEIASGLDNVERTIRAQCLALLRDLFFKYELDARVLALRDADDEGVGNGDKGERAGLHAQIAATYFPYVRMLACLPRVRDEWDRAEQREALIGLVWLLKRCSRRLLRSWWDHEAESILLEFFALLSTVLEAFEYQGQVSLREQRIKEAAVAESKANKKLLEDMYSGTGGTRRSSSAAWAASASTSSGLMSAASGWGSMSRTSGRSTIKRTRGRSGTTTRPSSVRRASVARGSDASAGPSAGDGDTSVLGPNTGSLTAGRMSMMRAAAASVDVTPFDVALETTLATEVSLVVLDVMETFVKFFDGRLRKDAGETPLFAGVFSVYLSLLETHQSERLVRALYASLRSFVQRFDSIFFMGDNPYCCDLMRLVMVHCNSVSAVIRGEATALIYLCMKVNFKLPTGYRDFSRMKLQATNALSELAGEELRDDRNVTRALRAIVRYSEEDTSPESRDELDFREQVTELMERFFDILRNSALLNSAKGDVEMKGDLLHRIAQGYMNAPNLRVTWLRKLMKFHKANGQIMEAAMCQTHLAALSAEFLFCTEPEPHLPKGVAAFKAITRNAEEEAAVADVTHSQAEGVTQEATYTREGLVKLLHAAVDELVAAELWEAANEVYKMLIPIYARERNYPSLAALHGHLAELFDKIQQSIEFQNRILSSYYRVGFYGSAFEDLDGAEFIYREEKITRLAEFTARLQEIYETKFAAAGIKVVILRDSSNVDRKSLDPNTAFVQITSVEPYFEAHEATERVTYYERNTNLRSFIFETPFTEGGKAHGATDQQYKRKTILKVEKAFPYLTKRIRVAERTSFVLTPIENALEEIERRVEKIRAELRGDAANLKTLQIVLQGSVRLQVNAGPMEIARVFLGDDAGKFPDEHVTALRAAFAAFITACGEAIALNRELIKDDQYAYHQDLEQGYKETRESLAQYIAPGSDGLPGDADDAHLDDARGIDSSSDVSLSDDDDYSSSSSTEEVVLVETRGGSKTEAKADKPSVPSVPPPKAPAAETSDSSDDDEDSSSSYDSSS